MLEFPVFFAMTYAMCLFALGMSTVVEAGKSPGNNERKRIAAAAFFMMLHGLRSKKFSDRSIVFWYS